MLYSTGFKFGENGQIKIWVHFGLQVSGGWIWPKFLVFSTLNQIGLGPRCKFQACRAGPLLKGLQIWGKRADQIWVHFGLQVRGGWIWQKFLVFSTHNLIGLGPPLQVSSASGRSSTQGASNLGKRADQNLGPFWTPGPWWLNLTKIFSLFSTQIKIWVHFGLQVSGGWIWPKF